MTTQDACNFVMPFGEYKGVTLRDIAVERPGGAGRLDWYLSLDSVYEHPGLKDALTTFLSIDWVSRMVQEQVEYRGPGSTEPESNKKVPKQWWEK